MKKIRRKDKMPMQTASPAAYDRAITIFSPDGRLFQVEYAKEAIKRGATAIGVKYKSGVILGIDKRVTSELMEKESIEKIHKIDNHVGVATSGLVADGRKLIDYGRVSAQTEKLNYNQPIDVTQLTKEMCDLKQSYTQYGGTRPFGVSLLVAGADNTGTHLYKTDPSGAYVSYKATVIGTGEEKIEKFLNKNYKENMNRKEAIKLVLKALKELKDDFSPKIAEIAYVNKKENEFKKLTEKEVSKFVEKE